MPEPNNKPSWADQMEEGEDYLPAPSEEVIGNNKVITEYKINEEGKKVKVILHYTAEKCKVSKSVAKRKTWKKYGHASNDPPGGPNPSNTIVSEEIFLIFLSNKEEDAAKTEEDPFAKLRVSNNRLVKCRICKEDHWTTQCPYKGRMPALPDLVKEEDKPAAAAANAQQDDKLKAGKYVPPSMRDGANRRGDAMPSSKSREELPTIRVTNLSEEVRDSDLQELFRPFGNISRVYLGKDKMTGQSKGFAFISFLHREDAARAIAGVHGYGYDNLILSVEWAKPSGSS